MSVARDPKQNLLLAALPEYDWQRWSQHLELVELPLGTALYEAGDTLSHAYFPTSSTLSILYIMQSGESAQIAVIGHEGVLGVPMFMGGNSTSSRAIVQNAGSCFRVAASIIKAEFESVPSVTRLLLRYTQALITQMTQTAACNKHHSLHQQLCHGLLLFLDRPANADLVMTRQSVTNMLRVPLNVMTNAVVFLENAQVIRFTRDQVTMLDRVGLERLTCECYNAVKVEYDRLLPARTAS